MSGKTKVLFAYNAMNIGGSTTSLLSILNGLDYTKFEVDLLLNTNTGPLLQSVPEKVNLLPQARKYADRKTEYFHRLLSPRYLYHFFRSKQIAKKSGFYIQGAQYREWKDIDFFRNVDAEYDTAVAFLEGDRCKFVARHIKAKRKIAWVHVNYKDAGFDPQYDRDTMAVFDAIVLVSQDCKAAFDQAFPELSHKTCVVENILATEYIRGRAAQGDCFAVDTDKLNLVTVCRINFRSKGLDRAVVAMDRLKEEGLLENVMWYILGDGPDKNTLQDMIRDAGLESHIQPLGEQLNPYCYMGNMDCFFLPSRWEGKPMAVTEAFMMGLPAVVAEYTSAHEQIRHGVDGFVMDNSTEGIYEGLKHIITHPEKLGGWKETVLQTEYSNVQEIAKVEQLIDG